MAMFVPAEAMSEISYKWREQRWLRIEPLLSMSDRDEVMCRPIGTRRNVAARLTANGLVLLNGGAQRALLGRKVYIRIGFKMRASRAVGGGFVCNVGCTGAFPVAPAAPLTLQSGSPLHSKPSDGTPGSADESVPLEKISTMPSRQTSINVGPQVSGINRSD